MPALLSLVPGLSETAAVLVDVRDVPMGEPVREWNRVHFVMMQEYEPHVRAIDCRTFQARELVARLSKLLRSLKKRVGSSEVRVICDRAEIGNQKVATLWQSCQSVLGVGPVMFDVDASKRLEMARGVPVISMKEHVPPARHNVVTSRDVAGAIEHLESCDRAKVMPSCHEYAALLDELNGFSWQTDRRRARALALAFWFAESSKTGPQEVGAPQMDETETRMMEAVMENWEDEHGGER